MSFVFVFSCTRESNVVYITDFPTEEQVAYEPVAIEQLNPRSVLFKDSLMLVTDWGANPRIKIYHKATLRHLLDYGHIGKGPNEFLEVTTLEQRGSRKNKFYIHDKSRSLLLDIDLNKIFSGEIAITDKIDLLKKNENTGFRFLYKSMFVYKNKILGEDNWNGMDKKFLSYDIQKNEHSWMPTNFYEQVPVIKNYLEKHKKITSRANLATTLLGYSIVNEKIVGAMHSFNRIDLMNFNFQVAKTLIYGAEIEKPPLDDIYGSTTFQKPCTLKNSFLVAYSGVHDEEIEKNNGKGSYEIHQYDYQGNPLCKFIIDYPVKSIHYDGTSKTVYAILDGDYVEKPLVKLNINPDYLD